MIADAKADHKSEDSFDQEEYFDSDDIDTEECTLKGKNMALNAFYRIARNTMSMYFKVTDPTASEVSFFPLFPVQSGRNGVFSLGGAGVLAVRYAEAESHLRALRVDRLRPLGIWLCCVEEQSFCEAPLEPQGPL